jgi:hypothetical protein
MAFLIFSWIVISGELHIRSAYDPYRGEEVRSHAVFDHFFIMKAPIDSLEEMQSDESEKSFSLCIFFLP